MIVSHRASYVRRICGMVKGERLINAPGQLRLRGPSTLTSSAHLYLQVLMPSQTAEFIYKRGKLYDTRSLVYGQVNTEWMHGEHQGLGTIAEFVGAYVMMGREIEKYILLKLLLCFQWSNWKTADVLCVVFLWRPRVVRILNCTWMWNS